MSATGPSFAIPGSRQPQASLNGVPRALIAAAAAVAVSRYRCDHRRRDIPLLQRGEMASYSFRFALGRQRHRDVSAAGRRYHGGGSGHPNSGAHRLFDPGRQGFGAVCGEDHVNA